MFKIPTMYEERLNPTFNIVTSARQCLFEMGFQSVEIEVIGIH